MARVIEIDEMITVGALADTLMLPVTRLITVLMKNGVMATVNEKIDFDTAQILVGELGLDIELAHKAEEEVVTTREKRAAAGSKTASVRPPVVAVMGHVDHGKTSLLDAIRGADVVKGEAGGITQHISAYQVKHGDRLITFLDTPGHEAFAALREHGAQLTDLVIIVVAADDGIKPQTLEAIRFARKAGVKILVAINKMDKEGADANRVKQQLAEQELLVEDWGGDTIAMEVSAKTKAGIPELLDMVLLVADVEDLRAETGVTGEGLVIESHMEQGRGPVAVALIEQGIVHQGDFMVAGNTYGKIRNLEGTDGSILKEAGPSTPVVITGFKALPEFGQTFHIAANEKVARTEAAGNHSGTSSSGGITTSNELMRIINRTNELQELNIIVKADVQGSLTSVIDSLRTLDTDEVAVRVVGSGVGAVTENDIRMAITSNAIIYGFHVDMPVNVKRLASRDKTPVRLFRVIYELIDDVKAELTTMLAPEVVETELGRLVVRGIFKTTKTEVICGGEVTKGKLTVPAIARITRGNETIAEEVQVTNLKRGPQDAKEIIEGEMCGLSFTTKGRVDLQEGDHIEFFSRAVVARSL